MRIFNNPRFTVFIFLLALSLFLLYINIKMPLAGEDYSLQPWKYNSAPATFSGRINAIASKVYFSATHWSPRIGEALTTITAAFPPVVFDIVNTLMFLWLVIVLFVIDRGRFPDFNNTSDGFSIFLIVSLIIALVPLLGQIFFWKAGTSNHLWGLIILLSFILPFRINYSNRIRINSYLLMVPYSVFGFLAGLTVENASVVVLSILLSYYVISVRENKIDKKLIFAILSFAFGVSILLFSPSTTIRRNYYNSLGFDGNLGGFSLYLNRFIRISYDFVKVSWPLLAIFIICLFIYRLMVWRNHRTGSRSERYVIPSKLAFHEIIIMVFLAYLSVPVLISIAYNSDQRRGFAFFWLVLISMTVHVITEIWGYLIKSWRVIITMIPITVLLLSMYQMGIVYTKFSQENNTRLVMIYSALKSGKRETHLPAITIKDSRIIETREILPDLGERIADYYGLDSVFIER